MLNIADTKFFMKGRDKMAQFWCGVIVTMAAEFITLIILAACSIKRKEQ